MLFPATFLYFPKKLNRPRGGERRQKISVAAVRVLGRNFRRDGASGAGIEYGITPNLSAKIEYRYIAAASLELSHNNEVLAGVNYRFRGP